MNRDTRSALIRVANMAEEASIRTPAEADDDTLTKGELRQLQSLTARLADAAGQMRNLIDKADARERRRQV